MARLAIDGATDIVAVFVPKVGLTLSHVLVVLSSQSSSPPPELLILTDCGAGSAWPATMLNMSVTLVVAIVAGGIPALAIISLVRLPATSYVYRIIVPLLYTAAVRRFRVSYV